MFIQYWNLHIVGTSSEWCVGLATIAFFLTYCFEFRKIKLRLQAEVRSEETVATDDDDAPLLH